MVLKPICPNILWSILWFFIFILTWPAAFIAATIEVFIVPFCACSEKAKKICEKLDRLFKILAFQPVDNMIKMRTFVKTDETINEERDQIPPENDE